VSTSSIVVGVAGATPPAGAILTAGLAGLFAGAMSMAAGEYVSVSSQRDAQRALLAQERTELAEQPESELAELAGLYRQKGLPAELAGQVARYLTAHDALAAHAETELGINPKEVHELTNPWRAALASMLAFACGAVFPLLAITLVTGAVRVLVTVLVAAAALVLTGALSARLGQARLARPIVRNVVGGLVAMGVTYGIGALIGSFLG
jgi:VIT1/CCC1 family predicted Fe2+/Mn2+ transporter